MLDWLRKELINQYWYSDIDKDRRTVKHERINGRLYDKHGVDCATTIYALVYKVPVPGIKQFKFAIQLGIARQHPCDIYITKEEGIEIAKTNALANPVMTSIYDKIPTESIVYNLAKSYAMGLPIQFVKTKKEMQLIGKNPNDYARKNSDRYKAYYLDLKKYLRDKYLN